MSPAMTAAKHATAIAGRKPVFSPAAATISGDGVSPAANLESLQHQRDAITGALAKRVKRNPRELANEALRDIDDRIADRIVAHPGNNAADDILELLPVVGDPPARSAERE